MFTGASREEVAAEPQPRQHRWQLGPVAHAGLTTPTPLTDNGDEAPVEAADVTVAKRQEVITPKAFTSAGIEIWD